MVSPVLADIYELDLGGKPDLAAYIAAGPPWGGIGLKATEGDYYPRDPSWFQHMFPEVRRLALAASRWGSTFFRYAYHYFRVDRDPIKQADLYLGLIDSAGGWDIGDLRPVVDVESAEQPADASARQVIDAVSAFTARIQSRHGRAPNLYAGSYIRGLGIKDHMGCAYLITAAYGATLPAHLYTDMGWSLTELLGWQYQGTEGYSGPAGYPRQCPLGAGPLDLTAITIADGAAPEEQLQWLRNDIASQVSPRS